MRITYGAAQGLEYLHDKADPPVIYRDLKSSNILLDENLNPKLSDVGLAKLGPAGGDKFHVSPRVMGTYGYSAPEYTRTGELTMKSDVYSFGVILLELITGRRAIDTTKPVDEQNLVAWVTFSCSFFLFLFFFSCSTEASINFQSFFSLNMDYIVFGNRHNPNSGILSCSQGWQIRFLTENSL